MTTMQASKAVPADFEREPLLSEKVAEMFLDTIVSRSLRPGDRLPSEKELGERFGVSRTVVREAIRTLAAKGIIEARAGSGLRVVAVKPTAVTESFSLYMQGVEIELSKVHEIRGTLEVQMAATASVRATPEDVATITRIHTDMQAATDLESISRLDVEFHKAIAAATKNQLYGVLLDAMSAPLLDVRLKTFAAGSVPDALASHGRILAAITAGDPRAAKRHMADHLKTISHAITHLDAQSAATLASMDHHDF